MKRYGPAASGTVKIATQNSPTGTSAPDIPPDLSDPSFIVTIDQSLMEIAGATPVSVDSSGIARYMIASTPGLGGSAEISLTLRVKSVTDQIFNSYLVSGATTVKKYLSVTGVISGAHLTLAVEITNSGS